MVTQNDRACTCRSGVCISETWTLTSARGGSGILASKVQRIRSTLRELAEDHLASGALFLASATKPGFIVRHHLTASLVVLFSKTH